MFNSLFDKDFFMNRYVTFALALALFIGGAGIYHHSRSVALDISAALRKERVVPVVVIGSGPAGLSAALYTARSALYTIVFQGKTPGGQLTTTTYVENWPGTPKMLGNDLIDQNRKQAEKFGALMVNDTVESVDFSSWPYKIKTEEGHDLYALTVIIATGATPRILNVPGEKEYWGIGVTTCAICDAPFYKDKKVVVVGGGDSAVEEAMLLTSYAKEVTMLVRGTTMRAAPAMKKRLDASGKVKILYNTQITKVIGDGKVVTGVEIKNTKDTTLSTLPIDGVFLAIGHEPNVMVFKNFIQTDNLGYIVLNSRTQETSLPGVFAAGDVSDHRYRQAGVAAGDGIKAALDAVAFLQEHGYNDEVARQLEKNYYDPHQDIQTVKLDHIVTNKDFDRVAKEHAVVVVKVGANYCPPCKALIPIVEAVAAQLEDRAHFVQVDLDDDPKELVKRFALKEIPTLLVFKKGKLVSRHDKEMFTKQQLYTVINNVLHETFEHK